MVDREPTAGDLMSRELELLGPREPVSRAIARMRARSVHELPVVQGDRLLGMFAFESVARRPSLPLNARVGNLVLRPPRLDPSVPYSRVADLLLESGLRALPVVGRHDRLLGIVSRSDVVRAFPSQADPRSARVEDLAGPPASVAHEREPVGRLFGLIRDDAPIPVVDAHDRLVGAVGLADLAKVLWRPRSVGRGDRPKEDAARGRVDRVEVRSIMRRPAVTVPVGTEVSDAARRMTREKSSSVFVVEGDRLRGVLTQRDVLLYVAGGHPSTRGRGEVFVQVHGFPLSRDPELLEQIDRAVGRGLRRIGRRVRPMLLDLELRPEGVHRTANTTVLARLVTDGGGTFYASRSAWNPLMAVARVLEQVERQAERTGGRAEQRGPRTRRGRPGSPRRRRRSRGRRPNGV